MLLYLSVRLFSSAERNRSSFMIPWLIVLNNVHTDGKLMRGVLRNEYGKNPKNNCILIATNRFKRFSVLLSRKLPHENRIGVYDQHVMMFFEFVVSKLTTPKPTVYPLMFELGIFIDWDS